MPRCVPIRSSATLLHDDGERTLRRRRLARRAGDSLETFPKAAAVPIGSCIEFPPFRLDLTNQELWRGAERIPLRAKPFAVLAYLAANPARLVLRAELVNAVWPDTRVGEAVLRGYVRELRTLLGDEAAAPRFIETVARRGYRFVAPIRSGEPAPPARARPAPDTARRLPPNVVGRGAELAELERRLAEADAGARQIVFVTGEPGIGKTTLVDAFARAIGDRGGWTARGQCVEHFGACEAYLPVLEALGRLGRQPRGEEMIAVLARHAPSWLVALPALVPDAELETLHRRAQGTTRERMLRELADAVEALTADRPLVLVLEDLQWSDPSTLDLLSSLARRREPARLLVVGTYRPAEVSGRTHPLAAIRQELQAHGLCTELALRALEAAEIGAYLAARLPGERHAPDLERAIHRATEGNPLFVVTLVDDWTARGRPAPGGVSSDLGVPNTLRQMIERQLDRLPAATRRMLEAASAVGAEFSAAAVAAALEEREEQVDEWCEELAGREWLLRPCGVDAVATGTVAGRYAFLHALYRQVLYDQLPATRRARFHRRIGEWQEVVHGPLAREHAAELAVHFEQAHDHARALLYLDAAAKNAMRRHACHEASALLGRALERLASLPHGPDRPRQELSLRMSLGTALLMTRGYAAPEVKVAYTRAHELCRHMEDGPELAFALAGLFRFFLVGADFELAGELAGQVLRVAETADRSLLAVAHSLVGLPLLSRADYAAARAHLEQAARLYDFDRHRSLTFEHGDDPGLTALAFLAIALWISGHPDQALARVHEARALAERLAAPYGVVFAQTFSAWIHVRRGDAAAAQACCDALIEIAARQGFTFLLAEGAIFRGWAVAAQGRTEAGLAEMHAGLATQRAGGAEMGRPSHLALLADAYAKAKRTEEGLGAVEEALATIAATGERSYEPELHRLKGDLLAQSGRRAEAEACLQRALELAGDRGARSLELRAALSLARLAQPGGRGAAEARRRLRDVYASFTEGFETADLAAARAVLGSSGAEGR
jgi:DNA-binding winged helix-turn-helix (wHTH) protein/predicted ATPase